VNEYTELAEEGPYQINGSKYVVFCPSTYPF
jgi:hypothetical protein